MAGPYGGGLFPDGNDPFTHGILQAVNIAGEIQRQNLARQNEALAQAREARAAQDQQEQSDLTDADLSTRLQKVGAKPATNQDLIDSQTGKLPNKIVKFGQSKWVLPTEEETDARTAKQNKVKLDQDTAEAGAKANAAETGRQKALQDRLDSQGVALDDETTQLMGWPKGTKVLPENLDDIARAVTAQKTANKVKERKYAGIQTDDKGKSTVIFDDGSTKDLGPIGKSKTEAKDPTDSPTNQRAQAKADLEKQLDQTASQIALDATDFKSADAALRKRAQTDPFVKSNYLLIRKRIKEADKQTAAETNADTINGLLGGDDATDSGAGAPAPKKKLPVGPQAGGPAVTPAPSRAVTAPAGGKADQPVTVTLPNGKTKTFPNQKSLQDFAAAAHLSFSTPGK